METGVQMTFQVRCNVGIPFLNDKNLFLLISFFKNISV